MNLCADASCCLCGYWWQEASGTGGELCTCWMCRRERERERVDRERGKIEGWKGERERGYRGWRGEEGAGGGVFRWPGCHTCSAPRWLSWCRCLCGVTGVCTRLHWGAPQASWGVLCCVVLHQRLPQTSWGMNCGCFWQICLSHWTLYTSTTNITTQLSWEVGWCVGAEPTVAPSIRVLWDLLCPS